MDAKTLFIHTEARANSSGLVELREPGFEKNLYVHAQRPLCHRVIITSETRYSPYRSLEAPDAGVIPFDAGEKRPTALISPDETVVIISSIRSISVSSRRELAPACGFFLARTFLALLF